MTRAGSVQGETETPDSEGEELTARGDVVVARGDSQLEASHRGCPEEVERQEAAVEGQSLVHGAAPPLRTVEGPGRCDRGCQRAQDLGLLQ